MLTVRSVPQLITVFLDEISHHVPLSTVAGGCAEQETDQSTIWALPRFPLGHLNDGVQEEVGALDLEQKVSF